MLLIVVQSEEGKVEQNVNVTGREDDGGMGLQFFSTFTFLE